jgi:aminopeptidase 2
MLSSHGYVQPTAARRAFPCWDEPALKATFSISLISRADTVNLSNLSVASEEVYSAPKADPSSTIPALTKWLSDLTFGAEKEQWKITRFDPTPKMSTYLVAWANGPFEHLESSYTSPISGKTKRLKIYATKDYIKQAQYALDVKALAMPLYERMFDIEYPLPKLDTLIAADFDSGAMENWGLITGRTSVYCLDPEQADIMTKKRVATVQCHEVAHQWFGNITTMEWWDNLYLNEGFATLMGEVVIPNILYPEWKVNTAFINSSLTDALKLDAKLSSHPIEVACPDANQANQIFDDLSYSKAGSVLRMLSDYVGEEVFLKGVSVYLKKHLYGNTVSQDLWNGISEAVGHDVGKMMQTWVGTMGFPYLTVTETEKGIRVRQDRFLETGPAKPEDNETIWMIPLSLLTVGEDGKPRIQKKLVLDSREREIELDTSKPFKLNAGTVSPVRVLYTPERLSKIAAEAGKGEDVFSIDDRIGLVSDAAALAAAGFMKTSAALEMVDKLRHENHQLVWTAFAGLLGSIGSTWFENKAIAESLSNFQRSLYVPLVEKLGYEFPEGESSDITLLRKTAITGASRDPKVIAELKGRFDHFMKTGDDSKMPGDIIGVTFATAVRFGGREEYEFMKQIHDKPKNPMQKTRAILALGATRNPEWAKETLEFALSHGREQDLQMFFAAVYLNDDTRRVVTEFFKDNYDTLMKRTEGNFSITYIVQYAWSGLASVKDADDCEAFFKDKDTSKYALVLQQTLDTIRASAEWIGRSTADVEEWLQQWK